MRQNLGALAACFTLWIVLTGVFGRAVAQPQVSPVFRLSDAFLPMDLPVASLEASLSAVAASPLPGYYETSEYLIGSVAVGVVFLESNGTVDTSREDWTPIEELQVMGEIQSAVNWWSSQYAAASVSFTLVPNFGVPTSYEPINRRGGSAAVSGEESLWISQAMNYLGYSGSDYFAQVRSFVNALRSNVGTNWAFAVFMVDSSADLNGRFSDGVYSAYSYLGGPFLVMTYDNDGWGINLMDQVAAHEIGHIFYATDEYNGNPEFSGYLNVLDVEGSGALMDANNLWLSGGTWGQVGWRDSDMDGILDIIDTVANTVLTPYLPDPTNTSNPTYMGTVEEVPYPNNNPNNVYGRSNVTVNTIKRVEYRVDGGAWLNAASVDGAFDEVEESFSFAPTSLSSGAHTIETRGVNSVGNVETSLSSDTLLVDLTAPVTSLSYSSPSFVNGSTTYVTSGTGFSLAAVDSLSGVSKSYYRVDSGLWATYTGVFSLTGVSEGLRTIHYYSEDNLGNQETARSFSVTLDNSGPSVLFTFAVNGSALNMSNLDVSWNGFDEAGIQYYEVKIDSGSYVNNGVSTSHTFSSVAEGAHRFYVRAFDQLGNSKEALIELLVDVTLPTLSLTESPRNASELRTSSVKVAWTGLDALSGVDHYEVSLDGDLWVDKGMSLTHTFGQVADGSHQLYVKVVDKAGNSRVLSVVFVVNTSFVGGPGWLDDALVFGLVGAAAVAVAVLLIRRRKK